MFNHFDVHFSLVPLLRLGVGLFLFETVNSVEVAQLENHFMEEQTKQAVWDCDGFKSPDLDWTNFDFMKEFLVNLKYDFISFFPELCSNSKLVKCFNCNFIGLIPKALSLQKLSYFHHISLIGCMYKVLAKVLANRLKFVIDNVILKSQPTFIKCR